MKGKDKIKFSVLRTQLHAALCSAACTDGKTGVSFSEHVQTPATMHVAVFYPVMTQLRHFMKNAPGHCGVVRK